MPVITSIKQQKVKNRVNIFLDGKFGFGIDLENYVKLGLRVEQELTEKQIKKIVKKAEYQETFDKILRFVMARPRSEKEIKGWLKRKEVHESLYPKLFRKLKKYEFVGDAKFARWWVGQRMEFRPKSIRELTYELRGKGISKNIIDDVLEELEIDELVIAKKLLDKKSFKDAKKAAGFLARKGFSWDIVRQLINFD